MAASCWTLSAFFDSSTLVPYLEGIIQTLGSEENWAGNLKQKFFSGSVSISNIGLAEGGGDCVVLRVAFVGGAVGAVCNKFKGEFIAFNTNEPWSPKTKSVFVLGCFLGSKVIASGLYFLVLSYTNKLFCIQSKR